MSSHLFRCYPVHRCYLYLMNLLQPGTLVDQLSTLHQFQLRSNFLFKVFHHSNNLFKIHGNPSKLKLYKEPETEE